MSRIAIVAALEREVRPLVKSWRASEQELDGRRFRFFEKDDVVLVCGGIGAQAARRAAEAVITLFAPKVIMSAGFAGALDSELKVADIMRATAAVLPSNAEKACWLALDRSRARSRRRSCGIRLPRRRLTWKLRRLRARRKLEG